MHSFSEHIRQDFPLLHRSFSDRPSLVYLDSAATTQKPQCVLDAMNTLYTHTNANIHRGLYVLSEEATRQYEDARSFIADVLHASPQEIVFTKNATEGINLVARTFGESLTAHDGIVTTVLEHHSNIVPWQQLSERRGVALHWLSMDEEGELRLDQLTSILQTGIIKLVAVTGMSNVLGSLTPLSEVITLAHEYGAKVLLDATQLLVHAPSLNVRDLDCDFLVFSGHKIYGPTGVGVLYIKKSIAETLPAFLGGGEMIHSVSQRGYTLADLPHRFEAGTPPIAEVIGLHAALRWFSSLSLTDRLLHEKIMTDYAVSSLSSLPFIHLLPAKERHGIVSFTMDGVHPHDVASLLGEENVCIRAGHHCAEPLHTALSIPASARLSIGVYTLASDIDRCILALQKAYSVFHA